MQSVQVEGSLIALAHRRVADVLAPGDMAVDATMGNGHDTLFLARCVDTSGRVYGFDIQPKALEATQQRLDAGGIYADCYKLYLKSHSSMANHVPNGIKAVMFNLGYLPGGDKSRITRVETTLSALEAGLGLLAPGGVLSVMCYPGHDGVGQESEAVTTFLDGVDGKGFESRLYQRVGAGASAPFLIVVNDRSQ